MAETEAAHERVEETAKELEEKYHSDALVYARTRSEAAQTRGDQPGKNHWEDVSETLGQDSDHDER